MAAASGGKCVGALRALGPMTGLVLGEAIARKGEMFRYNEVEIRLICLIRLSF